MSFKLPCTTAQKIAGVEAGVEGGPDKHPQLPALVVEQAILPGMVQQYVNSMCAVLAKKPLFYIRLRLIKACIAAMAAHYIWLVIESPRAASTTHPTLYVDE